MSKPQVSKLLTKIHGFFHSGYSWKIVVSGTGKGGKIKIASTEYDDIE